MWPVDSQRDPLAFLQELNQLVPTIKFKIEIEKDNSLPFLDTLVINSRNQLKFKVYRKPTSVEAFIHYFSNHDISVKRSMFLRALRICDPEFYDEEICKIYEIGIKLCFPRYFLEKCYAKTRKRFYEREERSNFQFNNSLVLPFRNEFKPLVGLLKSMDISVIFKYDDTIKNLTIKNSPKNDTNCGVYSIPCKNCNKVYIGQTGKQYFDRQKQHKYNIRTANESSALFQHQQIYNHSMDWDKGGIIFKCNRQTERLIIETCLIKNCNTMNLNDGLYKLDKVIINLLKSHLGVKRALYRTNYLQ